MLAEDLILRELGYRENSRNVRSSMTERLISQLTCNTDDEFFVEGETSGAIPLMCQFSKQDPHILAVCDEDGGVMIYNTHKRLKDVDQEWRAHNNAIFDIDWTPGEGSLLTASGDTSIRLWDVESEEQIAIFKGHNSSVKTVKYSDRSASLFASGSRDGSIRLWDRRIQEKNGHISPFNIIHDAHVKPEKMDLSTSAKKKRNAKIKPTVHVENKSVTSVIFQDDYTLISAGGSDGVVKVWDLRKTYTNLRLEAMPKHIFVYSKEKVARSHGFSNLLFDSTKSRLFASCMDHNIYQFSTTSMSSYPISVFKGHCNGSFYIRTSISPDDRFLVSGSSDRLAYIWSIEQPHKSPHVLSTQEGDSLNELEVSCIQWSSDVAKCAVLSDDCAVRLWRLQTTEPEQAGQVVGRCQKLPEKDPPRPGTPVKCPPNNTASTFLNSPLKSPIKMSFVLQNTKKEMSPSVKSVIAELNSGPMFTSPKKKAPMIFNNIYSKTCSPLKGGMSPLKPHKLALIMSPQKLPWPPLDQMKTPTNSSNKGCKRKLLGSPSASKSPKRRMVQDENVEFKKAEIAQCHKKLDFGQSAVSRFSSPTANMPNYVVDPKPRTPVGTTSGIKTRTPDWLTQMKIERSSQKQEDPCPTTPKLPSKMKKSARTPRSSPRLSKTPTQKRSILHYMSPRSGGSPKADASDIVLSNKSNQQ